MADDFAEYIAARAQMEQEGIHKIQKLLKAAGKQETADYTETKTQLNEVASKFHEDRNKIEEKAWKESVETAKAALKAIDDAETGNLSAKIGELDKAYLQAEGDIKRRVASRKITEQQGDTEILGLKQDYFKKLGELTEESIRENEKKSLEVIDKLKDSAKTEEEIKEATAMRSAEIGQNALDTLKAQTDAGVKVVEAGEEKKTKATEDEADKRRKIIEAAWQVAIQAADTYFDITDQNRKAEIEALEKQKQHELELAGENDEAKKQIEERYADRQRELRRRDAIAEKNRAVFSIIINTAKAVVENLANPILAALTGVLGALQLATVVSRPIPEFFKGKKDSYEGLGYVGDRGAELIERKDPKTGKSSFEYAAQRQLTYLGRHDKVYTHTETMGMIERNKDIQYIRESIANNRRIAEDIRVRSPMPWYPNYRRASEGIGGLTKADITEAVRQGLNGLPVNEQHWDDRGYREYLRKQNQRVEDLNNLRRWGKKKP